MLAANKIMIENGCGIISVPNECLEKFNEILCDYYTNDTLEQAKEFVYEHCIDGIDFTEQQDDEGALYRFVESFIHKLIDKGLFL